MAESTSDQLMKLMALPNSGATDILAALQNGVTALNNLSVALTRVNFGFLGGEITAFNDIGTTASAILPANRTRTSILFHNPNDSTELLVFPSSYISATFTSTNRAGGFLVQSKDYFQYFGDASALAWSAIAASSAGTCLTIATVE